MIVLFAVSCILPEGSAAEFDYEAMADLARKQKSRYLTKQTAARD